MSRIGARPVAALALALSTAAGCEAPGVSAPPNTAFDGTYRGSVSAQNGAAGCTRGPRALVVVVQDGRATVAARAHALEGPVGSDGRVELADDIGRRRMECLLLGDRLVGTEYVRTGAGGPDPTASVCQAEVSASRTAAAADVPDDQPD